MKFVGNCINSTQVEGRKPSGVYNTILIQIIYIGENLIWEIMSLLAKEAFFVEQLLIPTMHAPMAIDEAMTSKNVQKIFNPH